MGSALWVLVSFLGGFGLGVLNYRWYEKSIHSLSFEGQNKGPRKQVVKASIFRHLFVFLAGICLIRGASFAPFHLCGGLLLATFLCRYKAFKAQQ